MASSTSRKLFFAVVTLKLIIGLAYVVAVPLWQGHEPDYFKVVRFLHDEGRLPARDDYSGPASTADLAQATQPPLYFFVAYPIVSLLDDGQAVPPGVHPLPLCIGGQTYNLSRYTTTPADNWPVHGAVAAGYALRVLSLLFAIIAVIFTYSAGLTLLPARPSVALVGAALLAFEPTLVQCNSLMTNDSLLAALVAINLFLAARLVTSEIVSRRSALLMTVSAALAALTRVSGWATCGFSVLLLLVIGVRAWRKRSHRNIRAVLLGLLLLSLLGVGLGLFNLAQYDSVVGRYRGLGTSVIHTLPQSSWLRLGYMLNDTLNDYTGPLNALSPRALFVQLYVWAVVIGFFGSIWALLDAAIRSSRSELRALLLLIGCVLLAAGLVILRANRAQDNELYVYAPIRYYMPGVPALGLAMSLGFVLLVPPIRFLPRWNWPGALLAGAWLIVGVLWIIVYPPAQILRQAVISRAQSASVTGVTRPDTTLTEDVPQLLGYAMEARPADGAVELTTYSAADQPLLVNYMVRIDMLGPDGVANSCEFMPARGLYPTTRWEADQVIVDRVVLPNCLGELALPIEVRLSWLGVTRDGQIEPDSATTISLGELEVPLQRAASCPASLGMFDRGLQIIKSNLPPTAIVGERYLPSVNWLVLRPSERARARVYVMIHAETETTYTCSGGPRRGTWPFANWVRGEIVYFDECVFEFPRDAPTGGYTVAIGVQDGAGAWLPATDGLGQHAPDGLVALGELTLTDE